MSNPDLRIRLSLDGAEQVQAGAQRAAGSLQQLGQAASTAGQRTQLSGNQMAQVSAQLQDLFVQIQGGQAPLTALLQQGSQLSGVFGGVGNAARAMGSLLTPAVLTIGAVVAAVGSLGLAYKQGSAEADAFRRALVLTGNQAGVTVGQLQDMARAQAGVIGTQGKAAEVLAQLAATGKVVGVQLGAAADAAIRLERLADIPIEQTVKKFAELGKTPLDALVKLNEAEGFLTRTVYDQVKALEQQGRSAEAAAVAQAAYASTLKERTDVLSANLGTLERGWGRIKDAAKAAWDSMLDVGRPDTTVQKIAEAQQRIAAARFTQRRESENGGGGLIGQFIASRAARDEQAATASLAALNRQALVESEIAASQAAQAQATKDLIAADERLKQLGVGKLSLAEQETQLRRQLLAVGKDEKTIAEAVTALRANANKGSGDREGIRAREQEAALLEKLSGLSGTYYADLQRLNAMRQRGVLTEQQYVEAVTELTNKQPFAVELEKKRAEAQKASAKALQDLLNADAKYLAGLDKSASAIEEQVQKLRDEEVAAGIAAAQNISLAQAVQQVAIARLEESKAKASGVGDFETAAALEREIAARRELITLTGSQEARKSAADAAKDAEREWRRAADQINQSLTDALLRGFESGKSFARNLRDTLVNMFKTIVLRPLLSPIISGITGLVGGALGLSGLAQAAGTGAATAAGVSVSGGLLGAIGLGGLSLTGIGNALGAGFMNTLAGGSLLGGKAAGLLAGGASTGSGTAGLIGGALPYLGAAALIGNALGLFRSNTQVGAGVTGTLGGTVEDFVVNRKGGTLFSGPSYSTPTIGVSSLNADIQKTFNALRQQAASFAEILGLSGDAARNFTTALGSEKLSDDTGGRGIRLEGLTAEQSAAKIQAALTAANDELARAVLGSFADTLKKQGETATETLERLAGSLLGVNQILQQLGRTAFQASIQGADLASRLVDQFGGLQQYQQLSSQYFQAYYTDAERAALITGQITAELAKFGLSLPSTREGFRALIEAQDLSTEAGQKAYAALLQLSPAFASVVEATAALEAGANTSAEAIARAAEEMAEAGRRVLAGLADQQSDLEVELLRAQGRTADALALERERALAQLVTGLSAGDAAAATAAFGYNAALQDQIEAVRTAAQAQADAAAAARQAAQEEAQRLQAIAQQRATLEDQLLQLQGNTAELRARELAKLDPSNRTLQQQIYDLVDQQAAATAAEQAQRALADAQSRAAADAERAAEQFKSAWQSITDTLFDEVARIRGLLGGDGAESLAQAQARFAITTAQARAGDQDAAKLLPGLSQTLLQLAEVNAASLVDLQRIRAAVAASLEQTGTGLAGRFGLQVPQFAVGTNYVPQDMLAVVHEGEAIVPRAYNPAAGGSSADNAALVAEVRGLREENKAQALALVRLQTDLNRVFKRWDTEGLPKERIEA